MKKGLVVVFLAAVCCFAVSCPGGTGSDTASNAPLRESPAVHPKSPQFAFAFAKNHTFEYGSVWVSDAHLKNIRHIFTEALGNRLYFYWYPSGNYAFLLSQDLRFSTDDLYISNYYAYISDLKNEPAELFSDAFQNVAMFGISPDFQHIVVEQWYYDLKPRYPEVYLIDIGAAPVKQLVCSRCSLNTTQPLFEYYHDKVLWNNAGTGFLVSMWDIPTLNIHFVPVDDITAMREIHPQTISAGAAVSNVTFSPDDKYLAYKLSNTTDFPPLPLDIDSRLYIAPVDLSAPPSSVLIPPPPGQSLLGYYWSFAGDMLFSVNTDTSSLGCRPADCANSWTVGDGFFSYLVPYFGNLGRPISPNDQMIAYLYSLLPFGENDDSDKPLYVVDPLGGDIPHQILSEVSSYQWAPDSSMLAAISNGSIAIIDRLNTQVTLFKPERPGYVDTLKWSPDSQNLVFRYYDTQDAQYDVYLMTTSGKITPLSLGLEGNGSADFYDWSPDGEFIAWSNEIPPPVFPNRGIIYLFISTKDGSWTKSVTDQMAERPEGKIFFISWAPMAQ